MRVGLHEVVGSNPRVEPAMTLVCLPHAGAGGHVFRHWLQRVPATVAIVSCDLPGRGRSFGDPVATDLLEVASRVGREIESGVSGPWIAFGHSMGGLIAFEACRAVVSNAHSNPPLGLVVAACAAPDVTGGGSVAYGTAADVAARFGLADDPTFRGLPPDLARPVVEALRADLLAAETYRFAPGPPLRCRIDAFCGAEDMSVPESAMAPWRRQTSAAFRLHVVDGDHAFPHSSAAFWSEMNAILLRSMER